MYRQVRAIRIGTQITRYRAIPLIGAVSTPLPPELSTVDFDCRRSIDGEIDRRRLIEEEKGKRKRGKEEVPGRCPRLRIVRAPSPPVGRSRALAARGSPTRRRRPRSPRATIVPALGERPRRQVRGIANLKNSVLMQGLICRQWSISGHHKVPELGAKEHWNFLFGMERIRSVGD
ncbi:hypothetical protein BHM03_00051199 [Ensete ventricosum]|nr:hypothetical protein BHM03_00051199 [Ensete ventricosum]